MTDFLACAPRACTLPTAQRPLRLAEFDALFTAAARTPQRLDRQRLRLDLDGDPDLEARVRDLAARETECCSFFTFTVTAVEPGRVRLDIEVPTGHVEVLDTLAERAALVRSGR
jgi:hypothetical protein